MPLSSLVCIFFADPSRRISHLRKLLLGFRDIHTLPQTGPGMGAFMILRVLSLLWVSLSFLLVTSTFSIIASTSPIYEVERGGYIGDIATPSNLPPPLPPPLPEERSNAPPFRPSIAVIVGVITTMFSITFLLLLYAKHCKRGNGYAGDGTANARGAPSAARKNSGIDRTVIESLPVFRFRSLRGQKDGLECAVCLNPFEPTEVLRLLPKCKHAFHVECVDTWLDAHSTCPLCRYRVDPEDILLIEETAKILHQNEPPPPPPPLAPPQESESELGFRRVSGRHSSAGERGKGFLQIVLQRPGEQSSASETHDPTSSRRSFNSSSSSMRMKNNSESVTVGCFDRPRKDGLLLTEGLDADRTSFERRFEHRIIVSAGTGGSHHQRWSDVQASDLLYLRSEMIISDSRRFSSFSGSRPLRPRQQHHQQLLPLAWNRDGIDDNNNNGGWQGGRSVINTRCVSEITGLSRFSNRTSNNQQQRQEQEREAGLVARWLAWISQSQPAERTPRTTAAVV
uniref:RING-type E3 ubiquitin transferase n=1 Tax=Davidia involucrata TaxID=16924 RepID=A0A5B7BNL8_DAVIN